MRFDFGREQPYESEQFLGMLQEEVREGNARLEHPFVRLLFDGGLSLDQVRGWAKQDFALKRCPTWWNAGRLLNSPTLAIQRKVAHSLIEELGDEGGGHTEMYLRFGAALGVPEREMYDAPLLPSTVLVVDELMGINRHRSVIESLASGSVAGEAINVDFCTHFVAANDRVYGIARDGWTGSTSTSSPTPGTAASASGWCSSTRRPSRSRIASWTRSSAAKRRTGSSSRGSTRPTFWANRPPTRTTVPAATCPPTTRSQCRRGREGTAVVVFTYENVATPW